MCGQLKPDRSSTADVFDSDKRVVLQTARDASWQDPLTRPSLSVTPQDEQPEAPTALQDQQWRRMRKGTFHQLRAAHHCIHPSRVRSGFGLLERHLLIPCHTPSVLVSSLFLLPGRFLWTALCPQFLRLEPNVRNGLQIFVCLSLLVCWILS